MQTLLHKSRYITSFSKRIVHILLIGIVFSILFSNASIMNAISLTVQYENQEESTYIIELTEKNGIQKLLEAQQNRSIQLTSLNQTQLFQQIKQNISMIQQNVKQNIQSMYSDKKLLFTRQYNLILNAIVLKGINAQIAENIEKLPLVKRITRDKEISVTNLDISAPDSSSNRTESEIDSHASLADSSTTIAFFDTGVDYTHPALNKQYLGGYDFVNNDSDPMDDHGHGTHCAGIAVGNETRSAYDPFMGVAPDSYYYSYKVLNEEGTGHTSAFLQAFERAIDPNNDGNISDHVNIISISAGDPEGTSDDMLSQAAQNAVSMGIIVVSAAGNQGPEQNTISSPAIAQDVIAVGATSSENIIAPFSSRGSYRLSLVKPDVVAPGVHIKSTWLNHIYETLSGTSMACPYVAGYCALLLNQNPSWSAYEVKMALRSHAKDIGYNLTTQGYGKIEISTNITTETLPNASLKPISPIQTTEIDIIGTANGKQFHHYTCSYQLISSIDTDQHPWIYFNQGIQPVTNSTLCTWDTQNLAAGRYKINLTVHTKNQTSKEIIFVSITEEKHSINRYVLAPDTIHQKETFNVSLYSSLHLQEKALFLFFSPLRIPQIRIGTLVSFHAPQFYSEKSTIQSKILVIPLRHRPLELMTKKITIQSK